MAFDNLPPQPPFAVPAATAYAEQVLSLSKIASQQVSYQADIAYGKELRHQLDIYGGHTAKNLPILIFWHGGRWRAGYKEWNGFMAITTAKLPAILVSPRYGLSPDYKFPVPLHDCLLALSWVYENIKRYGGDPQRIYLAGHSAGGHLAALTTLRRDLYDQFKLPMDAVKGCLPLSGTMNFAFKEVLVGSEEEQIRNILLAEPQQDIAASPLHHVSNNTTPFYLTCGENDFPRVISTNQAMHATLKTNGCAVELHEVAGADHFQTHLGLRNEDDPWWCQLRNWLRQSRPPAAVLAC